MSRLRNFHLRMRRPGNRLILALFLAFLVIYALEAVEIRIDLTPEDTLDVGALLETEGLEALLEEVDRMEGDYHKRKALGIALTYHDSLPEPDAVARILQAGSSIKSDYDTAELLLRAVEEQIVSPRPTPEFLLLLESIESDFALLRVLDAALEEGRIETAGLLDLLAAGSALESDYEASQFLNAWFDRWPQSEPLPEAFFELLGKMESEYHRDLVRRKAGLEPST